MNRRTLFIVVGGIIILVLLGASLYLFLKKSPSLTLVVPEYVSVSLGSSVENNERVVALSFSAFGGNGCDYVSGLEIEKSLNGNTLLIDIKGYNFKKAREGLICPAMIRESRAEVSLDSDWFTQGGDKEVIFRLGEVDNKYSVSYNQYRLVLNPVQVTNVGTNRTLIHVSNDPGSLRTPLYYPEDVAILFPTGSVDYEKDYRPIMRDFAQEKGFLPAEQFYPGIEQDGYRRFFVVVENPSILGGFIGELPGEGIEVYLGEPR